MSTVKTTNITHGSNSGTANLALASDGSITFAKTMFASYAIICDQKAATNNGGTAFANAWTEVVLQTEIADPDSIVSISSNQFTLGAGNYLIKWKKNFFATHRTHTRLYDVTNSAVKQYGMNTFGGNNSGATYATFGIARVTPTGSTAYKFEYYVDNQDGDGQGNDSPDDEGVNIYMLVEIYKEA